MRHAWTPKFQLSGPTDKFTDKARITRVQCMSEKSDTPSMSKEDTELAAKKQRADETRQTRSKLQLHGSTSTATGSRSKSMAVLPRICLICKKLNLNLRILEIVQRAYRMYTKYT